MATPFAFADQRSQTATPASPEAGNTFNAIDLNYVALTVRDVGRSQKWYEQHLGLKPKGQKGFLTSGKGWLALFHGEKPGLNHYCYSITNYGPARRRETRSRRPDTETPR